MYDYREAIKADIINEIRENCTAEEIAEKLENEREAWAEELYDDYFINDSITGNASGSYYCNAYKAAEALMSNLDLLAEAIGEFGGGMDVLKNGAEACDVTIRCYLLGECLTAALEELKDEIKEAEAEAEALAA